MVETIINKYRLEGMVMLDKLLESAKKLGNDEFVKDFETAVSEINSTIGKTTERVKVLETELEGSISKKNKLRDLIKNHTGIEEISEENFTGYLEALKGKPADESIIEDNRKLSEAVNGYKSKLETVESEYKSKLNQVIVDKEILSSGKLPNIESNVAKSIILDEIRKNAAISESGLIYKDDSGSTVLKDDGTPLTLDDKINSMMDNPDYSMFFPDKRKKGGGKGVGSSDFSSHGVKDLSKLSRTEKAQLMKDLTPSEYQALVRANLNKRK